MLRNKELITIPASWDLDDDEDVRKLREIQAITEEVQRRELFRSPLKDIPEKPEEKIVPRSLAYIKLRGYFIAIYFVIVSKKLAEKTQQRLAGARLMEMDDTLDLFIPLCVAWFTRLFRNYFQTVTSDAVLESDINYEPLQLLKSDDGIEVFRIRLKAFLSVLYTCEFLPPQLTQFWSKLHNIHLYLPNSYLTDMEKTSLPEPDALGSRSVEALSPEHESLVAGAVILRALIEGLLAPRIKLFRRKFTNTGYPEVLRAADHLQLVLSIVYTATATEFYPGVGNTNPNKFQEFCYPPDSISKLIDDAWLEEIRISLRNLVGKLLSPMQRPVEPGWDDEVVDDEGHGDWIVSEAGGAEVYEEPGPLNKAVKPIGEITCGTIFKVTGTARGFEWLQTDDGWVHSRNRWSGKIVTVRVTRPENRIDLAMMTEQIELLEGPITGNKKLRIGKFVRKFQVVRVLDCVMVEKSDVFGVKYIKTNSGWFPTRSSNRKKRYCLPITEVFSEESGFPFKLISKQPVTGWQWPDWEAEKIPEAVIEPDDNVYCDSQIRNENDVHAAEWVHLITPDCWLPITHSKMKYPILERIN